MITIINSVSVTKEVILGAETMETGIAERARVGVRDFCLLEDFLNIDAFLENLRKRFHENMVHTYIGQVLIFTNPYKELPIYSTKHVQEYATRSFFDTEPHVFAISDIAYRAVIAENKGQCILISGESGSGKTEVSKKVLKFIAEAVIHKGEIEKVKDKILQSNPVLEAFGNAKTYRNDNSSRFGKYMDVEFDFQGCPVGGNILNYLLEKSRVVFQVKGERNFHIFYQLLYGGSDEDLEKFKLDRKPSKYKYLSHGSKEDMENIDDKEQYRVVKKALDVLEFSEEMQEKIFAIVASILHLGNVEFSETDDLASVKNTELVDTIAKILECDAEKLTASLTNKTIDARGDVVTSPLNKDRSIYARDALAKAIYDRLFTWLVNQLNVSLKADNGRKNLAIGILDIYGFEVLKSNHFEQFCINYCNERLQQLFIELTLKSEQEEYLAEGIEWTPIDYFNNQIICDLIDKSHQGIIAYMDEECLRPGVTSDLALLAKMNRNLGSHKHYISHERASVAVQKVMGRDEFRISHYAGIVAYNVRQFVEKNNDLLYRDLRGAMTDSTNPIINSVFSNKKEMSSMKRPDTVITQFKNSLNHLLAILMDKDPNYIRCIKPNNNKQVQQFDDELVTHQVQYLGLIENVRVRRAGFAYRRQYEHFLKRYKCLSPKCWPNYPGPDKEGVQVLVKELGYTSEDYRMGKTKIFIRFPKTLFETEDAFQAKKNDIASIIQSYWKMLLQRRKYLQMRANAIFVQKYIRRFLAIRSVKRRKHAVGVIRNFVQGYIQRNDPPNDLNQQFVNIARREYLKRLSKNLPKNLLDKSWPNCPHCAIETSEHLRKLYYGQLARTYRKNLSPERKAQLELKSLAHDLFKGQKKSYPKSVPNWFQNERLTNQTVEIKNKFIEKKFGQGEKLVYATEATKYDRHGYKARKRVLLVSNKCLYLVDGEKALKQKHCFRLEMIEIAVTKETDSVLLVKIPVDIMKKDKGDLILNVPEVIEAVTMISKAAKNPKILNIHTNGKMIHKYQKDKEGTIEVKSGSQSSIAKNKTGNLVVIVA